MSVRVIEILCFSMLLLPGKAFAQKYNFENYSVDEGLPNNVVRSIAQDELGFMYFGTNNGLAVYDGSVFSPFALPGTGSGQQVFRLKYMPSKKLWINYGGNKDLLLVRKGVLETPPLNNSYDINNFYEEPDATYFCTDWGLYVHSRNKLLRVQLGLRNDDRVVHFLFPVGKDKILVGRKGYSMALVTAVNHQLLDETTDDISVNDIRESPDGNYWIATDSHGLLIIDGPQLKKGKIRFVPPPPVLAFLGKEDIFCIAYNEDDQSLRLGTSHFGILIYRKDGTLERLTRNNGLSGNKVNCMFLDRDKTWWVGTDFGVDKLSNTSCMFYGTADGNPIGSTFRLEKDSLGRTWFFANDYFYYTENEMAYRADYPTGVEKIALGTAALKDGIWVSVPNHVFYIDTRGKKPVVHPPLRTEDTYRRMVKWEDRILLGGKRSLAMLHHGQVTVIDNDFIDIRALCVDHFKKLWVGTFSHGIYRVDLHKTPKGLHPKRMQQILDSNSNYNRFLTLMADDKGRIWAGTRFHGVYVYEVNEKTAVKKLELGMTQGLGNNSITSLTQVPGGDTWIGTSTGFDRYTENNSGAKIVRLSRHYRFNNSINQLMSDSANLWAATDVGAIRIHLTGEKSYRFPTYFKDITFPDSVRHLFTTDTTLLLKPAENSFSVTFTAPFYINEQQTLYYYRLLHGGPADWIEARTNHSINFNSLRSGRYTLELRSIPFNGQSDYLVSRLSFIIQTPFYRSTGFILLLFITGMLLVYLIYQYRINELKKLFIVRDNISRNLHDEIGATLSSINIYSDVARNKVDKKSEVRSLLDKIYAGSGQVMENMNDIVWYVNPKNDSWDDILVRMREFAIPILEAKNIDVSFIADEKLLHQKLSMQQRQNIYYIFKEAVNNAAKYSQATRVEISLIRTGVWLVLSIEDNGIGFPEGLVRKGNGMTNMKRRAQLLGTSLTIDSGPGVGTTVKLQIEIP
ncbi:MAG: two-component regulator propeller domain-containing protein [Chitinophagaceae bacterium]